LNNRFFHRASVGGFTLIEVLIAVIIIGLGMIGLSALFAGAARQQQIVALSSRAATAAHNTQSKITQLFTGFRDVKDLADCAYNSNVASVPAADQLGIQWERLNAGTDNTLSIFRAPLNANLNACTWAYFEQPVPEFSLFDARGRFGGALSSLLNEDTFSASIVLAGFNAYFPVRSVVADTLEIDVYIASDGTNASDFDYNAVPGTVRKFTYYYDPSAGPIGEGACNQRVIRLRPKVQHYTAFNQGWAPEDWRTYDHIDIDSFKCPMTLDSTNFSVAEVDAMQIYGVREEANPTDPTPDPPKTGRYIQRVVVRSCTHRVTNLLSLSDRVISETSASGVIRDVAGVSVMMRSAGANAVLVAVFSYALQGTREGARFIPVEPFEALNGTNERLRPIRGANVELVYNSDSETYWFFCTKAATTLPTDESWLARSGQTLVFAGNSGAGVSGADSASRVVRVVTLTNNRGYWCELERAPRAGNAVVGTTFPRVVNTPFTVRSAAGAAGNLLVYGVNSQASSRRPAPDNTIEEQPQWQLRPIDAQVFTISR